MDYQVGSVWRKWDLHVHTPESIFHRYVPSGTPVWGEFLQDLESLPREFKVLGVNDYLFVDGYRKLREEKGKGRLRNIDTLLPVIEFRLDKFGGSSTKFSKVNFHVIFSDLIPPEIIEQQFISKLSNSYQLSPQYERFRKSWNALPTKKSLEDLGKMIIESVPEAERTHFHSPLVEGFNNISFSLDRIHEALASHYFKDKFLLSVGKTEWADIKWNDHSIAEKKNIVNGVDLVFISAESIGAFLLARKGLADAKVNNRLIDCSDAHSFSSSKEKDRIGKCFTWVKADTSFQGLKHAVLEYDQRIYVGDTPPKSVLVENNKTKFIRSISIHKKAGDTFSEKWFDNEVPLNSDLVAIIGNRGSGKSALADITGLLGNSQQYSYFSFLNAKKFRDPRNNKAQHFEAALTWQSSSVDRRGLNEDPDKKDVEKVKYLPQNYLETICNEIGTAGNSTFDKELKKVIISHVSTADRLGKANLDDLITQITSEKENSIRLLLEELSNTNIRIDQLEQMLTPEHRSSLENKLKTKEQEIESLERSKPALTPAPSTADPAIKSFTEGISKKLAALSKEEQSFRNQITTTVENQEIIAKKIDAANRILQKIENFQRQFESFKKDLTSELAALDLEFDLLVRFEIKKTEIDTKLKELAGQKENIDEALDKNIPASVAGRLSSVLGEIEKLQYELDEPNRKYQKSLQDVKEWERRRAAIVGDTKMPDTQVYLKRQLDELQTIPGVITVLEKKRTDDSKAIYDVKSELAGIYKKLYKPVQDYIQSHPIARDKFQLDFDVSIEEIGFGEAFFQIVTQGIAGTYFGVEESQSRLRSILSKYTFESWDKTTAFQEEILRSLKRDLRSSLTLETKISDQLRKGQKVSEIYNLVFGLSYLKPKYSLKLAGKDLGQLSPGERGTLLLIFYLLVDKDDVPLIIDQPEENLDNQTVYQLLVPAVIEAKNRRQVVIVTHNPNLAVVCDAEQIISASIDKKNDHCVTYACGSLENLALNRKTVDILEGTMPAFDNRGSKYIESESA
ncbi:MAG: hypothetical protein Q8P51_15000 [Ignavibacteria bacterium]|nr:hypothetical protein [Ignavibacteria bacterium]